MKLTMEQIFDTAEDETTETGVLGAPPMPTLDQRANILLRAVRGAREFSATEYDQARETLLDEMASCLDDRRSAEATYENVPGSQDHHYTLPEGFAEDSGAFDAGLKFSVDLPQPRRTYSARSTPQLSSKQEAFVSSSARRRSTPEAPELSSSIEPLFSIANDNPSLRAPKAREKLRNSSDWWNGAVAGTAFMSIAALIFCAPIVWQHLTTGSVKPSVLAERRSDAKTAVNLPLQELQLRRVDSDDRLLELANKLLALDDVFAARLLLMEAAKSGNAAAALRLGITFDPLEIHSSWRIAGDKDQARTWYSRAKDLGSPEAQAYLDKLGH